MIKEAKRKQNHPLHSLCSYLGSYPPHVPRALLTRWFSPDETVIDPFCGAGTTLLEAKLAGRPSLGIDLNPLAVAISSAKIQCVSLDEVLHRLSEVARAFSPAYDLSEVPDDVRLIFHDRTIQQLCFLRDSLQSTPEDEFLRGAVLGIMHGKARRDGSSAYLSIDMPNTFSMSAGYVERYIARHNLEYRATDVFSKLRDRVRWLLRTGPAVGVSSSVVNFDATQLWQLAGHSSLGPVGGILTSPPYLGVLRYGAFNWIRLWFLRAQPFTVDAQLDTTDSLDKYLSFMATFLLSAGEVVPPGKPVVLVVGDVVEHGQTLELARRIWEELDGVVPFSLQALVDDNFDINDKTTRIWGEQRKGRATPVDRVLVLERRPL